MLRSDNIADENLPGLGDLGIAPTPIESVLPHYLSRFKGR
jgi:NADH dehydrogenase